MANQGVITALEQALDIARRRRDALKSYVDKLVHIEADIRLLEWTLEQYRAEPGVA